MYVHDVTEPLFHKFGYRFAELRGFEQLLLFRHVLAFGKHRYHRRVSGRSADTVFLHCFDERGFGIARKRFGEFLLRLYVAQVEFVAVLERGKISRILVLLVVRILLYLVHRRIALEHERLTGSFETVIVAAHGIRFDSHGHRIVYRVGHLAREITVVNELVQPVMIARQFVLKALRRTHQIDGTDSFVRVLHVLRLGGVIIGFLRSVFVSEFLADEVERQRLHIRRNTYRVRSDISNERRLSFAGNVHAFVQLLRYLHYLRRAQSEFLRAVLL